MEQSARNVPGRAQLNEFEQNSLPLVLDACCGPRMMWFDREDPRTLFIDKAPRTCERDLGTPKTKGRRPVVVAPDQVADFTAMPFPDESFQLVVFDPPHISEKHTKGGIMADTYGLLRSDWKEQLRVGFAECFRVLKPSGVLVFKWADTSYRLPVVLMLTPKKPLFGNRSGKHTHWCVFMKDPAATSHNRGTVQ
jgi:SAM-dependent methyltransferase